MLPNVFDRELDEFANSSDVGDLEVIAPPLMPTTKAAKKSGPPVGGKGKGKGKEITEGT